MFVYSCLASVGRDSDRPGIKNPDTRRSDLKAGMLLVLVLVMGIMVSENGHVRG